MRAIVSAPMAAAVLTAPALAAPIVVNDFTESTVQDFSVAGLAFGEFDLRGGPRDASVGEDSVTFTSTNPYSRWLGTNAYPFAANGDWNGGRDGYVALASGTLSMRFTFEEAVSGVGGFINYQPGRDDNATLRIYGEGDVLLEEFDLEASAPIDTFLLNNGAFRGFERMAADIVAFELSGAWIAIDDLTWSRDNAAISAPVPVPGALPLMLTGSAAFFAARRRRKG